MASGRALKLKSVNCMEIYYTTEKSLMIKYSRMQKEISSRLVSGSCGACLDCTLPGVQVTAALGFFSAFRSKIILP